MGTSSERMRKTIDIPFIFIHEYSYVIPMQAQHLSYKSFVEERICISQVEFISKNSNELFLAEQLNKNEQGNKGKLLLI